MLETNAVDNVHTGGYLVNVSLLYYNHSGVRVPLSGAAKSSVIVYREAIDSVNRQKPKNSLNLYESPADLIIPISGIRNKGFWFRIESVSDVHSKGIQIPRNTQKAVLEVYVSFHGNDEFWYSNPPDSYLRMNNLTTERGHGAYREVFVTIDDNLVGSVVPFPVIFTGGFNRLFWQPVVAIGAFNLPSYDFDVTPFLGLLLDRKIHIFGLGVIDSIPFWLVDANLHLWLDHGSSAVEAKTVEPHFPAVSIQRRSSFKLLNGSFKIVAKRKNQFMGWVRSSGCNLTTHVSYEFKFRSSVKFKENGTYKSVVQTVKTKTQVKVVSEIGSLVNRASVKGNYPLTIVSSTLPGSKKKYILDSNECLSFSEREIVERLLFVLCI
uniref:Putative peptide-N4-(N-acetyl-beta-glucosaminyl)asparagine amidase A-like n=1 Tax=Davidia involucrata TaxID=16924 RepID=A0A5B6YQ53_DAVIN